MPRYRVVDMPTFIDNTMRQPGEEVEYAGWPGSTLEPVDEVSQQIKTYYDKHKGLRIKRKPDLTKFVPKSAAADVSAEAAPVEDQAHG